MHAYILKGVSYQCHTGLSSKRCGPKVQDSSLSRPLFLTFWRVTDWFSHLLTCKINCGANLRFHVLESGTSSLSKKKTARKGSLSSHR